MTEMPDFVRRAIKAQGKVDPDEILERLDEGEEETVLGTAYPEPGQETIDLGVPIEPEEHA